MARNKGLLTAAAVSIALACILGGCADGESRTASSTQQGVSEVLQEQTGQAAAPATAPAAGNFTPDASSAYATVDYDLTTMGSDMVYATVYDMMENPATYEGKIVRMGGPYYHTHYDATDNDYFYVIIEDATACCSQGLEFVWGDGSRTWPDEYPEDGHEVVVTGRFEVYNEGSAKYVHLVDASLEDA